MMREVGARVEEAAVKVARALDEVMERLQKKDVYALSRNIVALSVAGMTVYMMATVVAAAMPIASQVFAVFGVAIGLAMPLLVMLTIASLIISLVKRLVR